MRSDTLSWKKRRGISEVLGLELRTIYIKMSSWSYRGQIPCPLMAFMSERIPIDLLGHLHVSLRMFSFLCNQASIVTLDTLSYTKKEVALVREWMKNLSLCSQLYSRSRYSLRPHLQPHVQPGVRPQLRPDLHMPSFIRAGEANMQTSSKKLLSQMQITKA